MSFVIFVGDTSPSPAYPITVAGKVAPITGATAVFNMRAVGGTATVLTGSATITNPSTAPTATYTWGATDTTNAGLGLFRGWYTITLQGGAIQTTPEFDIEIRSHSDGDPIASYDLCTVEHVRRRMSSQSTAQDDLIQDLVTAASITIMDWCGRQFIKDTDTPTVKLFPYAGDGFVSLAPFDARTVTQIRIDTDTTTPTTLTQGTDYFLRPIGGKWAVVEWVEIPSQRSAVWGSIGYGFQRLVPGIDRTLEITGTWGFPTIPQQAVDATIITVRAWLSREGGFGWADSTPMGDAPPGVPNIYWLPISARRLLSSLRRRGIG